MATDEELLAQLSAEEGIGNEEGTGFIDSIVEDTKKSFRAAGMMLRLYEPFDDAERKELQKRFAADAAMLAASTLTGGVAGAAMKGAAPIARLILQGALSGAAGTGTHAAIEGEPVAPAAAVGGVLGAVPFGGFGAFKQTGKKAAAKFAADEVVARRKGYIAQTMGELYGPQGRATKAARDIQSLYEGLPAEMAARQAARKTEQEFSAMVGATQQVNPFDLPVSSPMQQRTMDPFSLPRTGEELLQDARNATARTVMEIPEDVARLHSLASGMETPGRMTIRATVQSTGQGRDARGRFTTRQVIKGLSASTPDPNVKDEAARVAREAFIDFLGGAKGLEGEVKPRLPRSQSRYLRPGQAAARARRMRRPSDATVTSQVREFLDMGAEPEIVAGATANEVVRRQLLKLPGGEKLESAYHGLTQFLRNALVPVGDALNGMGPSGTELSGRMSTTLDRAMRIASDDIRDISGLRRLSIQERRNVAHVLHGDEVPLNDRVAEVAATVRNVLNRVGDRAEASKIAVYSALSNTVRPFAKRNNYYPLEYSEKTIRKYMLPGPEREEALRTLMATERAVSREEAEAMLNRYLRPSLSEFRYGHLQMARETVLPGWEEDPLKTLPQYLLKANKRIETAVEFGADDAAALKLITKVGAEGGDWQYADRAYRMFADKEPKDLTGLARLTRNFNILSLLSTAGIVQLSQIGNTVSTTGFKNYVKGLATLFADRKPSLEFAARAGSYMQEITQDLLPFGERSWTQTFLTAIGMTPLDRVNRITAALAGRFQADDLAQKLIQTQEPKALAAIERGLRQIGLNPSAVRELGGQLTPEMRKIAAQRVAHLTQFRGSVLDLPLYKNSTAGQFLYLFRTYALQQTKFVHNLTENAFKHGEWGPMIRFLTMTGTLTPAIGAAISGVRYGNWLPWDGTEGGLSMAENRPDREGLQAYLENAMMGGAVGYAYDVFRGMYNGPQFMRSLVLGPAATDAIDLLGTDIPELTRGNPQRILHDAIKHAPLLGRRAADWLVPLE